MPGRDSSQSQVYALLHAASFVESRVDSKLSTVGLSLPKLAALYHLVQAGDSLPLGQLAERLSCVKSNVTQLMGRLEADGLVARTAGPGDRRSRLAVITDAGRRAFEQGARLREEAERELFGVLSEEEAAQLAGIIEKLERRTA
jgi:DNA-binding MarR family transcriptional regulator